jgi:DNA-binding transcriptional ArsR family regulator
VIRLRFGTADVGRVRFALSPTWEAVTSLRALTSASPTGLHGPWLARARPQLGGLDLELLTTVVRPVGYLPDFLVPIPLRQVSSFESGLAAIAATDPRLVATELDHLSTHPVAMRGTGRSRRQALLRELVADPAAGLVRIVAALEHYWRAAVAPHWSRIRALLTADLEHRLRELAAGGVRQLFGTLHPAVSFDGDTLHVVKYYDGTTDLRDRGLLLVPCVFAWPDVLVRTADPQPAVTYAPRGVGRLWDLQPVTRHAALAGVLGASRTSILAQLELPMSTTHLADQLGLAAPTVSVHLRALGLAGIVSAHRDGHSMLYQRTRLGDLLLSGEPDD